MTEVIEMYGHKFVRSEHGRLIEKGAKLPTESTASIYEGAVVYAEAAEKMHGGVYRGGVYRDGEFRDGVYRGGVFWGGKYWSSPCCAQRHDGYMFVAKYVDDELRIWAGCRNFSWDEAVAHWNDDHRHGAESQRIIHFLKAQADAERERDAGREGK